MADSNKWKNHFLNMSKSANRSKFYLFKHGQPSTVKITSQTEDAVKRAQDILSGGKHTKKSTHKQPKLKHDSSKKHSTRKGDSAKKNSAKKKTKPDKKLSKVSKKKTLKSIKGGRKKKSGGSEITVFETS